MKNLRRNPWRTWGETHEEPSLSQANWWAWFVRFMLFGWLVNTYVYLTSVRSLCSVIVMSQLTTFKTGIILLWFIYNYYLYMGFFSTFHNKLYNSVFWQVFDEAWVICTARLYIYLYVFGFVVAVTPRKNGKQMSNFSPSVTPTRKRILGKAARKSATSLRQVYFSKDTHRGIFNSLYETYWIV